MAFAQACRACGEYQGSDTLRSPAGAQFPKSKKLDRHSPRTRMGQALARICDRKWNQIQTGVAGSGVTIPKKLAGIQGVREALMNLERVSLLPDADLECLRVNSSGHVRKPTKMSKTSVLSKMSEVSGLSASPFVSPSLERLGT